jgi:hypothetical protein
LGEEHAQDRNSNEQDCQFFKTIQEVGVSFWVIERGTELGGAYF